MITPFNLQDFILPADTNLTSNNKRPRRIRTKPAGRFLLGPVCWDWITAAAKLPGAALGVGLVVHFLDGFTQSKTIRLSSDELRRLGIPRTTGYRALVALEKAGLVSVRRRAGRQPEVTILPVNETPQPSKSQ